MAREIKFRGRQFTTGKWIYGDLLHGSDGEPSIQYYYPTPSGDGNLICAVAKVIPETVGQLIGIPDSTEKDVYHGDIVQVMEETMFGEFLHIGVVDLRPDGVYIDFPHEGTAVPLSAFYNAEMVLKGNEFEHPELLKSGSGLRAANPNP